MGHWTKIKRQDTKDRAQKARSLKLRGFTVHEIAKRIERSESRLRKYLRGKIGENWNSGK